MEKSNKRVNKINEQAAVLGEKIKRFRKQEGLTQEQLAEKIGIDNKHLSRIEKGFHMPTYNILKRLSSVLDFDIYNLDNIPLKNIENPDKFYIQSLNILKSANNENESKYYFEVLQLVQKGLKMGNKTEKN